MGGLEEAMLKSPLPGLHAMSAQYMGTMVDRGKGGPGGLGISMALDKVLVWKREA